MDKKKTTIQDIANYANVSAGTVDRVIHNRGKVSPAKKKKIEEAIERLNFNPNFLARTLALGKQFVICTLFPKATTSQSYWLLPKKGIGQIATEYRDFGVALDSFEYSLFDESSFVEHTNTILERDPDGVVLAPLFEKESILFTKKLEERNIPYIFIDANIPDQKNLSYIGPDLKRSGYIAGKLMDSILGLEDDMLVVSMVKGIENSTNFGIIEEGFRSYFELIGSKDKRKITSLTIHSINEEEVFRELTKCYLKNPGISGVFVTNSRAHIISKFHRVHELTTKVIGFDLIRKNIDEMHNGAIEFLISQSPVFQGKKAVQTLFDFFMYNKTPMKVQYVPLDIIIKENIDYYINSHG